MDYNKIMTILKEEGTDQTRKIYTNHGADLELYGVSMATLKKIAKKVKINHEIGLQLLHSKNVDAIYLSRWLVDPMQITIEDLEIVLLQTEYYLLIENAIPFIAASNPDLGFECIEKWLSHEHFTFREAAYSIYSYLVGSLPDDSLNFSEISEILDYIQMNIHQEENRVRYVMNNFVIAVGAGISSLTSKAQDVANSIGTVEVTMGKTACKVPFAPSYIQKIEAMEKIGIKRKIT